MKPFTHVVVDGSNLATEGRAEPSLKQLNEAVLAFIKEFPGSKVTVVVDATFGHRIDRRERNEFDEAINNNELVAPPAGAVGRGDGFVLTIADKVKASVLSNDSYQEFHDQYKWLFDEGRLIGGKPVPNVGWVFIQRLPVRKQAGRETAATLRRAKTARAPMRPLSMPKSPPPKATAPKALTPKVQQQKEISIKPLPPKINELTPFLNFVENHPIGTKIRGSVESYASHGVYVKIGEVSGYLPMRLMANPIPRSAREHVKLSTILSLVVVGYTPTRRSVELAVSGMESFTKSKTQSKTPAKSQHQRVVHAKSGAPRGQQAKKAKRRSPRVKPSIKKQGSNKKR